MESYNKKYHRIGHRYGLTVSLVLAVCLSLFIIWFVTFKQRPQIFRQSVVIMANPVLVWSFNTQDNSSVLISIPSNTVVEAVKGYGRYSISSLWQLGVLDKKDGNLVIQSLQEALGIPMSFYIGLKSNSLAINSGNSSDMINSFFTYKSLPSFLTSNYRTNISFFKYLSLLSTAKKIARDKITRIDLSESQSLTSEILPDGTNQLALDSMGFEKIFGHAFEDEQIRKEHLSITINNTTKVPILGQKVARLLNHLGMLVVTVGNDTPQIDQCQLIGTPVKLKSKTAKFILDFYNCRAQSKDDSERTDLTIKLGTNYAALFLPNK